MAKDLSLLQLVEIQKPCLVPWTQMQGDAQVRFCTKCSKNVYDLSAMTEALAEQVIREHPDGMCAQITRRRDGRIVTRAARSSHWRPRWTSAIATAILSGWALLGFGCGETRRTGGSVPARTGGIVSERPTTQPSIDPSGEMPAKSDNSPE